MITSASRRAASSTVARPALRSRTRRLTTRTLRMTRAAPQPRRDRVRRLFQVRHVGVDRAVEWNLEHMEDDDTRCARGRGGRRRRAPPRTPLSSGWARSCGTRPRGRARAPAGRPSGAVGGGQPAADRRYRPRTRAQVTSPTQRVVGSWTSTTTHAVRCRKPPSSANRASRCRRCAGSVARGRPGSSCCRRMREATTAACAIVNDSIAPNEYTSSRGTPRLPREMTAIDNPAKTTIANRAS